MQVAALWPLKISIVVAGSVLAGAFFSLIIALHVLLEKLNKKKRGNVMLEAFVIIYLTGLMVAVCLMLGILPGVLPLVHKARVRSLASCQKWLHP